MGTYLALYVLVTLFASVELAQLVQVNVTQGTLQGEVLPMVVGNGTYISFKGIPYAAPPIGTLRFKAPEPPANWTGVRNATTHGASCPQIDIFTSELYPGSENCLFLNVYTPNVDCTTLLPVMFFIHGGGYKSGSGNSSSYGADFLVNQSVVLVTINYRLEALGFLCLDTKEIPGNAGLKDQVAALRWVKENIVNFGGDPDCITIIGQSAGAASVGYHILSPMSKGLFNRAIAMSGTPLCDFTISYKPVERAFILGKQLGIDTNDTTVLMNYLQNVTVDQLYNTSCTVLTSEEIFSNFIKFFSFAPVNETDFGNNNTFITKDVMEMMTNGTPNAVDVMLGYTNLETVTVIDTFNSTYMKIYDRYPEMLVPTKIFFRFPPDINLEVSKQIRNYYFGNATINVDVIKQFVLFTSQASFQYDIIRFINILPEMCNNSRYMYKFSMSSGLNTYGNQGIKYGLNGAVGHLDDLMYIFMNNNVNTSLLAENSTEMTLIVNFSTMIANFAKYGNPTPANSTLGVTWPQFDTTNQSFLEIGNNLTVGTVPDGDMITFWKTIFEYVGLSFY